jgi:NAD(P)-dependent dehydrogenase (short-subunit alcohol dehydrogenase family)
MPQTVLITGTSSGIGEATARHFQQTGWNVAATMRTPEKGGHLNDLDRLAVLRLDVTEPDTIRQAVDDTLAQFGRLDAVVNNAGYGLVGPFEAASPEEIQRQFEVNVFGLMAVTRAVLPHFRAQRSGTLINVASMGGRITFPLYSVYHATKWAVEGFSEALQYEVEQHGIRVKIIEPGPIKTDFYDRSQDLVQKEGLTAYDDFVERAMPNMQQAGEEAPGPEVVAKAIYKAATDDSARIRYPVNSQGILLLRRLLPSRAFMRVVEQVVVE